MSTSNTAFLGFKFKLHFIASYHQTPQYKSQNAYWKAHSAMASQQRSICCIYTFLDYIPSVRPKSTYGAHDRQTPQVTPQSATPLCQNTTVILTSRESRVQDQLTPKFPIKQKSDTCVFTQGSQLTPRAALPLARTTSVVFGWIEDCPMGRRA